MQNKTMLKRSLLYTAITRAKKNLVMVGQPQAFITALKTLGNKRETMLTQKLQEQLRMVKSKITNGNSDPCNL